MTSPTLITFDSLYKKAVVSLDDGQRVGYVEDILVDAASLSFGALVIKGDRGESVLPREQIRNVGEDAITVDSVSSTQSAASSIPGLTRLSTLRGQKVLDSSGNLLGQLHDVDIDASGGDIFSLDVRSGGVFGVGAHQTKIAKNEVCSFGPGLITVNAVPVEPA